MKLKLARVTLRVAIYRPAAQFMRVAYSFHT